MATISTDSIATAIAALQDQHAEYDEMLGFPLNTETEDAHFRQRIAEIEAAIDDLEALQADTAAAAQLVAMPGPDRIASLEIVMSGLDDYWAIQPEALGHIANVHAWLDELQRRPQQ